MRRTSICLYAVLVLFAAVAFGATYGTIKVTVTDKEGSAIPGATVEATSPVFIGSRTAVTDASGTAVLTALTPGTYQVRVALSGFQTATLTTKVTQNETVELNRSLALASIAESITVTAEAPLVDTTRATVADEVTLQEVEALPVSRDYRGYAQLVAGVNVVPNQGGRDVPVDPASKGGNNYRDRTAEGRTGGTGSRDNQYYLDGLIITDIYSGEGSMSFNNEVILEQQVITSGIPAEFAGGKGFVGNIVTKSGGNEFSGSVNYYMMSPDFYSDFKSSDNRLHTSLEDKNDAAVTFGGPIMRDRMWFFLSGQMLENSDEVQLSTSASPNGGVEEYKNDPERSDGKEVGERLTVDYQCPPEPSLLQVAQLLQGYWAEIGVDLVMNQVEQPALITNVIGSADQDGAACDRCDRAGHRDRLPALAPAEHVGIAVAEHGRMDVGVDQRPDLLVRRPDVAEVDRLAIGRGADRLGRHV